MFLPFIFHGLLLLASLPSSAMGAAADPRTCVVISGIGMGPEQACYWDKVSYGVVHFVSFGSGIDQEARRNLLDAWALATSGSDIGRSIEMESPGFEGEASYCLHLGLLDANRKSILIENVRLIASSRRGVKFSEHEMCGGAHDEASGKSP